MILQLNPAIPVDTPLGKGLCIFIIDYGMHLNSCWMVALKDDGQVKHFDSNDIRLTANHTYALNIQQKAPDSAQTTTNGVAKPPALQG